MVHVPDCEFARFARMVVGVHLSRARLLAQQPRREAYPDSDQALSTTATAACHQMRTRVHTYDEQVMCQKPASSMSSSQHGIRPQY
jgi:hypothetical protein